jgi:hypothetical protein
MDDGITAMGLGMLAQRESDYQKKWWECGNLLYTNPDVATRALQSGSITMRQYTDMVMPEPQQFVLADPYIPISTKTTNRKLLLL